MGRKQPAPYSVDEAIDACKTYNSFGIKEGEDGFILFEGLAEPKNPRCLKGAAKILAAEVLRLRRGEFICQKCGIRKDGEHDCAPEF